MNQQMTNRICEHCKKNLENCTKPGSYYLSYDADTWRIFCSPKHADFFYRDKYQMPLPFDNAPYSNRGVTSPSNRNYSDD